MGVVKFRVDPEDYWESTCYGWTVLPPDLLAYTADGFDIHARLGSSWDEEAFPILYEKDVYKRTSGFGVGFADETPLTCWQRLLIIALHLTIKILDGADFYDQKDFRKGFGHPDRGCCDARCNCHCCRPRKLDPGPLQPIYTT